MRTMLIILGGFVLMAICIAIARAVGASANAAIAAFAALWFVVAAVNMWIGVARAGYAFKEELPIFLVIFLVPVAVAVLVRWKLL